MEIWCTGWEKNKKTRQKNPWSCTSLSCCGFKIVLRCECGVSVPGIVCTRFLESLQTLQAHPDRVFFLSLRQFRRSILTGRTTFHERNSTETALHLLAVLIKHSHKRVNRTWIRIQSHRNQASCICGDKLDTIARGPREQTEHLAAGVATNIRKCWFPELLVFVHIFWKSGTSRRSKGMDFSFLREFSHRLEMHRIIFFSWRDL